MARRKKTQARWRARNPDYATAYRIQQRGARKQAPEPLRLPAPLSQLPWDLAKDELGVQGADFIAVMGTLLLRSAKDQFRAYLIDPKGVSGTLPLPAAKDQFRAPAYCDLDTRAGDAIGVSPTRPAL